MSEWKKVKLGECISTKKGFAFKSALYTNSGVPVVRVSDFTLDSVSDKELVYYPQTEKDSYCEYVLNTGDILIQTVGSWQYNPNSVVGKVVRVPYYHKGSLLNQNIVKIIPNKDYNNAFLFYRLKCRDFAGHVIGEARGAANQASITLDTIKNFRFDCPPIEIQHRIATILSRYDSLIEDYQKQIKLLEEAAQRLYKEWFIDLRFPGHENTKIVDGVPEGWEKKRLVDMVDVQYGYAFDGKLFNSNGEGVPILRIRNIPDGITSDYTTEEAPKSYIVHNGDIVVGMDGIFHINSWSGGDAYLVQRACSFRPKNENMRGFIFQAIQEPIKFFEQTLVGATVAHLGKKHIDSIQMIIPSNEELYVLFQKVFIQRQNLLYEIRLLTEARDRLLPKLMSGEIKVEF
jgi:type I restriction enzyme S subunit